MKRSTLNGNGSYHNQTIGALSFDTERKIGAFEYEPSFLKKGIELSPLKMPLSSTIFRFPELDFNTFKGFSGLIADSYPMTSVMQSSMKRLNMSRNGQR